MRKIIPPSFHQSDVEHVQRGSLRPGITDSISGDIFPVPILQLHQAYLVIFHHDKVVAGLSYVR